jgi:copper transporter 1
MDGFLSWSKESKGSTPCLNLLFVDWTLDNDVKFGFACFGVFLFAIATEYLKFQRKAVAKAVAKMAIVGDLILMAYHGMQVTLGYFLMLIAMMYSAELFACLVVGLCVGYALFNLRIFNKDTESNGGASSASEDAGECCKTLDFSDETNNARI